MIIFITNPAYGYWPPENFPTIFPVRVSRVGYNKYDNGYWCPKCLDLGFYNWVDVDDETHCKCCEQRPQAKIYSMKLKLRLKLRRG